MKMNKSGFTLIELLVVIVIIALLVSLLIPAVQAAREMARRSHCANSMKQLGLGLSVYHDSMKSFPPGNLTFEKFVENGCHSDIPASYRLYCGSIGWPAFILPQLEQMSLYEAIDFDLLAYTPEAGDGSWHEGEGPKGDPKNQFAAENMPSVFSCPSAMRIAIPSSNKDYGVNGAKDCPERLEDHEEAIFWNNSATRLSDIKDGASNTFLLLETIHSGRSGESHQPNKRPVYGSNPFFWVNHASQGYVVYTETLYDSDGVYCGDFPINNPDVARSTRGAKSDHPRGINTVLCDGSVHFVGNAIDFNVYKCLFTRAGNEDAKLP
jgi:prepilin-type N-terminal cleavage/methylation domain-containing protein